MNKEFLDVLRILEQEKGIPFDYMIDKTKEGIKKAVENFRLCSAKRLWNLKTLYLTLW